jgi:hypothetical protein
MKQEATLITEKSETMTNLAEESSVSVENFNTTMNELNGDAHDLADIVEDMENSVFITLAKIDHIIFKANAYDAVVAADKTAHFPRHTDCRLGKWHETTGKEKFAHTQAYSAYVLPHKITHDMVLNNLTFIKDGDTRVENEDIITSNFRKMEDASHELFTLIDQMTQEAKHNNNS